MNLLQTMPCLAEITSDPLALPLAIILMVMLICAMAGSTGNTKIPGSDNRRHGWW